MVWNASFERGCLTRAAAAIPELGAPVSAMLERIVDALPLVRDHVYHPEFGGSFSLKRVLPALVPELRYDALEITDGQIAERELEELLLSELLIAPDERERIRHALKRYCELDAWGVARLIEVLEDRARTA